MKQMSSKKKNLGSLTRQGTGSDQSDSESDSTYDTPLSLLSTSHNAEALAPPPAIRSLARTKLAEAQALSPSASRRQQLVETPTCTTLQATLPLQQTQC